MERLGFDRSMDKLTGMLDIGEMITDAHTQIAAAMRHCEKYSEIKHSWDIWHGGKNIHKKILEASKQSLQGSTTLGKCIEESFLVCRKGMQWQ
ncbi:uncharacterized protein [Ptychodera flava]|uniref:uncharacterized protein isoform X2 n=1 Tax=Ptychodera flava TaxID=63121 RepID=UPI00396A3145